MHNNNFFEMTVIDNFKSDHMFVFHQRFFLLVENEINQRNHGFVETVGLSYLSLLRTTVSFSRKQQQTHDL